MLTELGIDVSYETSRRWILKFGPAIAANVRTRRVQPSGTWHFDEVFVRIGGKRTYLWRAVDDEGEVLEVLAQSRRNKRAALKLMRKLLKKQGYIPDEIVTDKLGSYSAALRELGLAHLHVKGGRLNNRAEVSHPLPGSGLFAKPREEADADENAAWAGSSRPDRCNVFCPSTMPSTTISICNVI
jgi:transposase-like protein